MNIPLFILLGLLIFTLLLCWKRIINLEKAIRNHRDQRGDDKCWLDDQELYKVLGDGNSGDNALPPRDKFLLNCSRYYDNRCRNANWPSYQELETKNKRLKEKIIKILSEY